jgi:hypothetical protein
MNYAIARRFQSKPGEEEGFNCPVCQRTVPAAGIESEEIQQETPHCSMPQVQPVNGVAFEEVGVWPEEDSIFEDCQPNSKYERKDRDVFFQGALFFI